jgi:hypothetical protein
MADRGAAVASRHRQSCPFRSTRADTGPLIWLKAPSAIRDQFYWAGDERGKFNLVPRLSYPSGTGSYGAITPRRAPQIGSLGAADGTR